MSFSVIILAAGLGKRMQSNLPKMLHTIGGKYLLRHIISTITPFNPKQIIVVYGHQGEQLQQAFSEDKNVIWVEQKEQNGTGHAALQALPYLKEEDEVLIWYGDIPLIKNETLKKLFQNKHGKQIQLITMEFSDPEGLGRIKRNEKNEVVCIVEEKECTDSEKKIKEVNTGFFTIPRTLLQNWLPKLKSQNTQQEYYLTDLIPMAVAENIPITTISPSFEWEVLGINTKAQLAQLERIYQLEYAKKLMAEGVLLRDPNRFDCRGDLTCGHDVIMDVNVILEGTNNLGNNVEIGPNVYIKDSILEDGVRILPNSVIENAKIEKNSTIGPFARIRPGTTLGQESRVGNFVEVKNSTIGARSKMNHLSYIGDAIVGTDVNIGAGTITCNYDGYKKHQTIIGDHVFIGSDTQLIAPVTVGKGATIGAGTTIMKDVPPGHLIHNRVNHRSVENWIKEEKN